MGGGESASGENGDPWLRFGAGCLCNGPFPKKDILGFILGLSVPGFILGPRWPSFQHNVGDSATPHPTTNTANDTIATKTPIHQVIKALRHQDTKTPRHRDTKTPRHQDVKTPKYQVTLPGTICKACVLCIGVVMDRVGGGPGAYCLDPGQIANS